MTNKIFKSIMAVAGAVLLASLIIIMGCLYNYFGTVREQQLHDELSLAAVAVEQGGAEYLSELSSSRYRLTWVDEDGKVLYDTQSDAAAMENHADRKEIKNALRYGEGDSVRYSTTLMEKTMYYARRLADGSVLRISVSQVTVAVLVLGMLQPIVIVLAVALVLSGLLAKRVSRTVVEPLNRLDLEHPLENDTYEEIAPLLTRINQQYRRIDSQVLELQRRKDEFQQVIDNMRECLVLLNENGTILSINQAARSLFGASQFCMGKDFLTIERSHDMSLAIEKAKAEGHSQLQLERNGRTCQFELSRIESENKVCGVVLLAFDVKG